MKTNFERCLTLSRVSEGGYSNNPHDDGGPTMKGITLAVYRGFMHNNKLTANDLKKISDETVAKIYKQNYWDKVRGDDLPLGLDYCLFDYALNSGPGRPAKAIQRIVGVDADGAIGPKTLKAIGYFSAQSLIVGVCDERLAFMHRAKNSKGELLWTTFGKGWQRRVDDVREDSLAMARQISPEPVQPPPPDNGLITKPAQRGLFAILKAIWDFIVRSGNQTR